MRFYFNGLLYESTDSADIDADYDQDDPSFDKQEDDGITDISDMEFEVKSRSTDPSIVVKKVNLRDKLFTNIISFIELNLGKVPEIQKIVELQHKIFDDMKELAFDASVRYNNALGKDKDAENINSKSDSTFRRVDVLYRFLSYYIIKYDKQITEWYSDLLNKNLFNNESNVKAIEGAYSGIYPDVMYNYIGEEYFTLLDDSESRFNSTHPNMFDDATFQAQEVGKSAGLSNGLDDVVYLYTRGVPVKKKDGGNIYVIVGKTPLANDIVKSLKSINDIVNSIVKVEAFKKHYIEKFRRDMVNMNLTHDIINKHVKDLENGLRNGSINKLSDFNKLLSQYKQQTMSSGDAEKLGQRANSMNKAYKLKLDKIKSPKTNNQPTPNK
jgi:hypothetical protein